MSPYNAKDRHRAEFLFGTSHLLAWPRGERDEGLQRVLYVEAIKRKSAAMTGLLMATPVMQVLWDVRANRVDLRVSELLRLCDLLPETPDNKLPWVISQGL